MGLGWGRGRGSELGPGLELGRGLGLGPVLGPSLEPHLPLWPSKATGSTAQLPPGAACHRWVGLGLGLGLGF